MFLEPTSSPLKENASLETVKVGHKYELLEMDEHKGLLKKRKREEQEARPDIVHQVGPHFNTHAQINHSAQTLSHVLIRFDSQCLLTLLDSPLNKAGRLQIYIHTANNVLIEVNPRTRIPRTYKRFAPLMSANNPFSFSFSFFFLLLCCF